MRRVIPLLALLVLLIPSLATWPAQAASQEDAQKVSSWLVKKPRPLGFEMYSRSPSLVSAMFVHEDRYYRLRLQLDEEILTVLVLPEKEWRHENIPTLRSRWLEGTVDRAFLSTIEWVRTEGGRRTEIKLDKVYMSGKCDLPVKKPCDTAPVGEEYLAGYQRQYDLFVQDFLAQMNAANKK
jgi:hypothetical protein